MRVKFCRWCLFLVQIHMVFAADSTTSSAEEKAAVSEASTTAVYASDAVATPTTILSTTTVTTTTLPTTTTPMMPPDPPSDVSVSSLKPRGLYVWWTHLPSNATYYKVHYNNTFPLSTNKSNYNLLNLLGGSFYVIGVEACFQDDICSSSTQGSNITYPSMPENLELINRSINSLTIQWRQYGGYTNFTVTVNYHDKPIVTSATWFNVSESINSSTLIQCEISGLKTPGGNYTVQVSAVYESLQSEFQNSSFLTKPDQPRNVSLVNRTVDTLCVNWTQAGVVERFSWSVNDTSVTLNGTLPPPSNNTSAADCYPCEFDMILCIHNLTTAGEMYSIEISATVSDVTSDPLPVFYSTAPPAVDSVICLGQTNTTLSIQIRASVNYRIEVYSIHCSPVVTSYANMSGNFLEANATVVNLTAGMKYTVEARTISYSVLGDPAMTSCSTIPNVPKDFSSTTGTSESIYLSWGRPEGYLQSYELFYTNDSGYVRSEINGSSEPPKPYNLSRLSSDSNYTIKLCTSSFSQCSANETTSSWTLSEKVSGVSVSAEQTLVNVNWKSPLRSANVFVYNLNISSSSHYLQIVYLFCKKSPSDFLSGTRSSFTNVFNFSCESEQMMYPFKGLNQSTTYNISIAAVNPGGRSQFVITNAITLAAPNYAWVAGVVVGCLVGVLLIVLLVILFMRWRKDRPPFSSMRQSSPLDSIGGEENPTYEEEPEPVAVEAFVDHVNRMSQDSNYLYACEYMLLNKLSAKNTTVAAELPDNRSKNRYTDILPFDNSRVKLIPEEVVDEGDSSDYINASFLPGFNSKREYIAAQGPMRSTVDSFWLMIWQQNVSMVVMVTNLSERGREKCEQYWPDNNEDSEDNEDREPLCYGNVTVQFKSESLQDFYTIRTFEVSYGSEKRRVSQYHFLTWPDFGIPEDMEHILTFVREIRNNVQGTAPLLVHCSAGVGRTGTFIVVDHLLQLIKKEQWIDLFHIVLELRQHRPKMIQAESQYVFAHECIRIAIEKGLHRGSCLDIVEDEQANGDCLYVNASEAANDVQLYANASEIHEQSV